MKCYGSNEKPKAEQENDWFIGKTVVCPECNRALKPNKQGKVPTHTDKR